MAKTININGGTASVNLANGSYSVSGSADGYTSSSINPASVNITEGTDSYSFTINADGTLTLHVSETGTSEGTSVSQAVFSRTDASGNTYGSPVTSDSSGIAVFNNVPYANSGSLTVYYKQTSTDSSHTFDDTVKSVTLTSSATTIEIQNPLAALRTINLTDANYENLPIEAATITLE